MLSQASVKPRLTLTPAQIGLILGLESVLASAALVLCCPTCAREGQWRVITENGPEDMEWKVDCACRERRISRAQVGQAMGPSGDLLLLSTDLLRSAHLAVRCPSHTCLLRPLDLVPSPGGLTVTCQCGTMQFRHHAPSVTTH